MSVQRRNAKSGVRWDVRLRAPDGRVYTRTFRTKKEAEGFAAREIADRGRGVWTDPSGSSVTFGDWADQWLESDPAKRVKTLQNNRATVRLHLKPRLGRRPLGSISALDVQKLVNELTRTHRPNSVHRYYETLRAILNSAVDSDLLGRSPCRGIKLPVVVEDSGRALTPDEVEALADAIGERYQALVYTAVVLGLRWSELAGLRVGRVDFLRRTLTVAETLHEVEGKLVTEQPKSRASHRLIALPAALAEVLAVHLTMIGVSGQDPDAYVFRAPRGGPLRYASFPHSRMAAGLPRGRSRWGDVPRPSPHLGDRPRPRRRRHPNCTTSTWPQRPPSDPRGVRQGDHRGGSSRRRSDGKRVPQAGTGNPARDRRAMRR